MASAQAVRRVAKAVKVACQRGHSVTRCSKCSAKDVALSRSSMAREAAAKGALAQFSLPATATHLGVDDYLSTEWGTFLQKRGFLQSPEASGGDEATDDVLKHVLSSALTHPLTIAHGIAKIVEAIGLEAATQLLVTAGDAPRRRRQGQGEASQHAEPPRIEITIVGARAEAGLQPWAWSELALACSNMLEVSNLVLNFCGPALRGRDGDSLGATPNYGLLRPVLPSEPVLCKGSRGEPVSLLMRHYCGFYQDIALMPTAEHRVDGGSLQSGSPLVDSTTLHCLLNPGITHPQWHDAWTPALELISASGQRNEVAQPVLMTSFDSLDHDGDSKRAAETFGPSTNGVPHDTLHQDACAANGDCSIDFNPFRSLLFDELWENDSDVQRDSGEAPPKTPEYLLRQVQSNWSARVYLQGDSAGSQRNQDSTTTT